MTSLRSECHRETAGHCPVEDPLGYLQDGIFVVGVCEGWISGFWAVFSNWHYRMRARTALHKLTGGERSRLFRRRSRHIIERGCTHERNVDFPHPGSPRSRMVTVCSSCGRSLSAIGRDLSGTVVIYRLYIIHRSNMRRMEVTSMTTSCLNKSCATSMLVSGPQNK